MKCTAHDPGVLGSNLCRVKLGVRSPSKSTNKIFKYKLTSPEGTMYKRNGETQHRDSSQQRIHIKCTDMLQNVKVIKRT